MKVNFDKLKSYDLDLYKIVAAYGGFKTGEHELRDDMFPQDIWGRIVAFATPPQPAEQEDSFAKSNADIARRAEEGRANARIQEYIDKHGLIDDQTNAELLAMYFKDRPFTVANVDAAIKAFRPQLFWKKPTPSTPAVTVSPAELSAPAAPPPLPAARREVLGTLPDGTRQLPLDATPTRHHSKDQLKDWLKRTREKVLAKPTRLGHFGAKF